MHKLKKKMPLGRGKLLPFEQPAAFFLRRGMVRMNSNELVEAVGFYLGAIAREAGDVQAHLSLAEAYTRMHRFDESNGVLFPLLAARQDRAADCYFLIGCNYVGLQEHECAQEIFRRYEALEPDEEFLENAEDMLAVLREEQELDFLALCQREDLPPDVLEACLGAEHLMLRGDYDRAIAAYGDMDEAHQTHPYVKNSLALAHFGKRELDTAVSLTQQVLRADPEQLAARCNLVMFQSARGETHRARRAAQELADAQVQEPQDINRVGVALMEVGMYKEALRYTRKLHEDYPYDAAVAHSYAVCLYELEYYAQAGAVWAEQLKLAPGDAVAAYYQGLCRIAAAGGERSREPLPAAYQLPDEQTKARKRKLNDYALLPRQARERLWREEPGWYALVRWGLELNEAAMKIAMLELLDRLGDERAVALVREFAISRFQPDALKYPAFGILARLEAGEPYFAYIDGRLVQGQVHGGFKLDKDFPACYQDVLHVFLERMAGERSKECMALAVKLYERFCAGLKERPELSEPQVRALASAIEYLACKSVSEHATKSSVAAKYDVSLLRLNAAISKILNLFKPELEKI